MVIYFEFPRCIEGVCVCIVIVVAFLYKDFTDASYRVKISPAFGSFPFMLLIHYHHSVCV